MALSVFSNLDTFLVNIEFQSEIKAPMLETINKLVASSPEKKYRVLLCLEHHDTLSSQTKLDHKMPHATP